MSPEIEQLVRRALTEAEDALESLRRCHGADVQRLCYPAVNTVRDACEALRNEGLTEMPIVPTAIYAALAEAVRAATSRSTEYVGGFVLAKKLDELAGQR